MAKYKCVNNVCVEDRNGRYTESTCGGKCSSSSVTKKYACKNNVCVEDPNGRYTDSNCGGSCPSTQTPTTNNCSDVDKKYTDQGYVMTLDVERYRKAKNKGTYEVDFKFCASDNKNHYYYKPKVNAGTVPPPNQTSPTGYSECGNGTYKKGCKGNPIKEVQQCLINNGYTLKHGADGKFGKYTEEALLNATNKKEFTKDEITTICQKMKQEKSLTPSFGKEEQKAYWEDLIKKGSITSKGIIRLINDVTYAYIIKYMKDGTKVQITDEDLMDETKLIQSFDEFDYVVLSPINPADKATAGEVSVLTAGLNQNDEVEIQFAKDGNWKPAKSENTFELEESDSLVENTIKSILKLRLLEQTVTRTIGSSSTPSKPSSVRGGGTSKSNSTTSSNSSSTPPSTSSTSTPPSTTNNGSAIDKGSESLNTKTKEDATTKKVESGVGVDPKVKSFLENNGYTFEEPNIDEKERLSTRTTIGQQLKNLDGDGIYEKYYSDTTPIWKSTDPLNKDVVSDEGFKQLIKNINSEIPVESKRPFCRSSIKLLYQSAFPSTRVVQLKKRSVIENDVRLNQLKSAIIRCDEEKNFFEGAGGMRDELTALYRCRSNKKGKSYYGVDRYCLTDYKKLKQDNPAMQRESIVKKHIAEAIKNKQKDVMVESILRDIKGLKK